jgi:cytochrome c peroxidase
VSTFASSLLRSAPRARFAASRTAPSSLARLSTRRAYSSEPPKPSGSSQGLYIGVAAAAVVGGGLFWYTRPDEQDPRTVKDAASPQEVDYQKVYNAIAESLEDENYDGSFSSFILISLSCILTRHAPYRRLLRSRPRPSRLARFGCVVSPLSSFPSLRLTLLRRAGTYDKATNSGGSNGATMRFAPEGSSPSPLVGFKCEC